MRDVTAELLDKLHGPGEYVTLAKKAKPAKELTPSLAQTLALALAGDRTIGSISNALAYSHTVRRHGKREQTNILRLIKGGHLRIVRIEGSPPLGTNAKRDSPYGEWYYEIQPGRS